MTFLGKRVHLLQKKSLSILLLGHMY